MDLLMLAPEIQEEVLLLPADTGVPQAKDVVRLAGLQLWSLQRECWQELLRFGRRVAA